MTGDFIVPVENKLPTNNMDNIIQYKMDED